MSETRSLSGSLPKASRAQTQLLVPATCRGWVLACVSSSQLSWSSCILEQMELVVTASPVQALSTRWLVRRVQESRGLHIHPGWPLPPVRSRSMSSRSSRLSSRCSAILDTECRHGRCFCPSHRELSTHGTGSSVRLHTSMRSECHPLVHASPVDLLTIRALHPPTHRDHPRHPFIASEYEYARFLVGF